MYLYLAGRRIVKSKFVSKLEGVKKRQRVAKEARHYAFVNRAKIWRKKKEFKKIDIIATQIGMINELIEFLLEDGPVPTEDLE
ncbi:hypothetical protein PMAYCL1PPCAC_19623 [Pristionchus mayeri]|uniref:Uncharacterized protein n=1 Tax=Pristionchus mayeri TaxID=1317129 RepID=A0AAN5CRJ2_9BILA|nr:hypothetical protein PMAYCL1PPCAC_19623 [Pristionchus mayeri]